jgi:hypothetical protein
MVDDKKQHSVSMGGEERLMIWCQERVLWRTLIFDATRPSGLD